MKHVEEHRIAGSSEQETNSRRSFLTMSASLGTALFVGVGHQSLAEAQDATSSQGNLDPASLAQSFMSFPGSSSEFTSAFKSIRKHENAHVAFLVNALGSNARPKPSFQGLEMPNVKQFIIQAGAFENTGAGAYLGATPAIDDPDYLAAAGSIALVEGRHAGFINVASGQKITLDNANFEVPLTANEVAQAVSPFVKSLNGGPPLKYNKNRSNDNDIMILNFALALEYLEAEFYNINVPKFY